MASATKVRLGWTTVHNISTTAIFVPVTGWGPSAGLTSLRSTMEMAGRYGNAQAVPAYQTCNDPRNPSAAVAIPIENDGAGGYADSDGTFDLNTTVTTLTLTDKEAIRFGFLVKVSVGSNGGARVRAKIEVLY